MRLLFLIPIILVGCTSGYGLKPVKFDSLLHDSNSKVWMIEKHIVEGVNIAPLEMKDRKLIIFYADGEFSMTHMKSIGKTSSINGLYYMDSAEKELQMFVGKKSWILKMDMITEDTIKMHSTKLSEIKQDIHIVPLPKF